MTQAPNPQSRPRKMLAELQQMRDELRLKLHLAGMDARDAFDALDERVSLFEERLSQRHPEQDLSAAFERLRSAFGKLRESWSD